MGVDDITVMMELLFLLIVASITQATPTTTLGLEDNLQWEKFKLQHVKVYPHREEEEMRKDIFRSNLRKIAAHNEREEKGLEVMLGPLPSLWADMQSEKLSQTCLPLSTGGRRELSPMQKTRAAVDLVGLLQRLRILSPTQQSTMSLSLSSALKR